MRTRRDWRQAGRRCKRARAAKCNLLGWRRPHMMGEVGRLGRAPPQTNGSLFASIPQGDQACGPRYKPRSGGAWPPPRPWAASSSSCVDCRPGRLAAINAKARGPRTPLSRTVGGLPANPCRPPPRHNMQGSRRVRPQQREARSFGLGRCRRCRRRHLRLCRPAADGARRGALEG